MELTKSEKEVHSLILSEYLTAKQLAIRRQCSRQAINKIMVSLKKKGYLTINNHPVDKSHSTMSTKSIRLHAQEWNIKILFKDERYQESREKSNVRIIDGNTVRLYKESLEIYGKMFYNKTANLVTMDSFQYWNRFFVRLESELNIIILKKGYQNINLAHCGHYAEIDNGLARMLNNNKEWVKITATEDGKVWFTFDNSLKFNEAEAVHSQTSKHDMQEVLEPFFNDLRDNRPFLPSQMMGYMKELAAAQINTQTQLSMILKLIAPAQIDIKDESVNKEKPFYVG